MSIEEAETVSSDGQDETAGGSGEAGAKFPVGEYSYVAPVGGLRTGLTIEESGIATIVELMSGTGESHTYTYQITAKPGGGGATTYVLSPLDGGDERILTYEESSGSCTTRRRDLTGRPVKRQCERSFCKIFVRLPVESCQKREKRIKLDIYWISGGNRYGFFG